MINICKNCKKEFQSKKRTKKFCSLTCLKVYRSNPDVILQTNLKRKNTNIRKYGVNNPAKI